MVESGIRIADRYVLEKLIATGGMGAVWRGRDAQLDRPVAVKLLRNSLFQDNDEARQRFEREARAAARLKGSGFATVYDHGNCLVGDEDVAYLVMELVEGESLSALLDREEHLTPEQTMAIAAAVADALRIVHREGIVHRDIKPGNILIEADGTVKLVDFGIARINDVTSLTSTGVALGTLHYASPEQVDLKEITAASDLYSLGVVAYECLAGEPPFPSNDRTAVVAAHLSAAPPPLPESVPPRVADVVTKALEKDPRDRWASAEALAEACRAAADGDATVLVGLKPEKAEPQAAESAPAPASRPAGLWSWRLGFVAVAVVAIMLLTAVFAWGPGLLPDDTTAGESPEASGSTEEEVRSDTGSATVSPVEDVTEEAASPEKSAETAGSGDEGGETGGGDTGGSTGGGSDEEHTADTGGGDDDSGSGDTGSGGEEVPNLYSVPVAEAQADLNARGFDNVVTQQHMSKEGDGSLDGCDVVMQDPGAGTMADYGDTITLTYYAFASHLCW